VNSLNEARMAAECEAREREVWAFEWLIPPIEIRLNGGEPVPIDTFKKISALKNLIGSYDSFLQAIEFEQAGVVEEAQEGLEGEEVEA